MVFSIFFIEHEHRQVPWVAFIFFLQYVQIIIFHFGFDIYSIAFWYSDTTSDKKLNGNGVVNLISRASHLPASQLLRDLFLLCCESGR